MIYRINLKCVQVTLLTDIHIFLKKKEIYMEEIAENDTDDIIIPPKSWQVWLVQSWFR